MNNSVFSKSMEHERKYKDIKLVAPKRRRNYLASKPNYHTTKFVTEHLLGIEIRKTQIIMNKSLYSSLSLSDLKKKLLCGYRQLHSSHKNR